MTDFAIMKHLDGSPVAIRLSAIEAVSVNEDGGSLVQINGCDIQLGASVMDIMEMLGERGYNIIVHRSFADVKGTAHDGEAKEMSNEKA